MRHPLAFACTLLATPLAAHDMRVVSDFAVTQSLVQMVMGDLGQVDALLPPGGNAHSFQMRPSQAQALADAELIVWMGPQMTGWLDRALEGLGGNAHRLTLLQVDGIRTRNFGDARIEHGHDDHGHDHGHDHAHDHGHGHDHGHDHGHSHDHGHDHSHDHAGHKHTGLDPHAWMDPANAMVWLDAIADELAEHDPDHAAQFRANAEAAKAMIADLSRELTETFSPAEDIPIVVFHDAYGYLADAFDLDIAGTIALGDAAEPGAQRIAELRALLAEEGAVCVFPEVNHSSRYITVVLEGTGVKLGAELDPEGAKLEPGADLYPTLMRNLARDITECVTR